MAQFKIGDRVLIEAVVTSTTDALYRDGRVRVMFDENNLALGEVWVRRERVRLDINEPAPAPSAQRKDGQR